MKDLKPIDVAKKLKQITKIDVFENTRKQEVIEIRMLLCYLLRQKLGMRWVNIVKFFSNNGIKSIIKNSQNMRECFLGKLI